MADDITFALSRTGIADILNGLANIAGGSVSNSFRLNPSVKVDVDAQWRFQVGEIRLSESPEHRITLEETDLIFNNLTFKFSFDIPDIVAFGSWIDLPLVGAVRLPGFTMFIGDEDVVLTANLSGLRIEVEGAVNLSVSQYGTESISEAEVALRHARETFINSVKEAFPDLPEETLKYFNLALDFGWEVRTDPRWADIDWLDEADMAGDAFLMHGKQLIEQLEKGAEVFQQSLPAQMRSALEDLNVGLSDVVRNLLDIGDDIETWFFDMITGLGIVRMVQDAIYDQMKVLYLIKVPDQAEFELNERESLVLNVSTARIEMEREKLALMVGIDVADV